MALGALLVPAVEFAGGVDELLDHAGAALTAWCVGQIDEFARWRMAQDSGLSSEFFGEGFLGQL